MTVVVSYFCSDGVVIAADSMLTSRIGVGSNILPIGHHSGLKVYVLPGPQLYAFAGDPGQAARFKLIAEINHGYPRNSPRLSVILYNYPALQSVRLNRLALKSE